MPEAGRPARNDVADSDLGAGTQNLIEHGRPAFSSPVTVRVFTSVIVATAPWWGVSDRLADLESIAGTPFQWPRLYHQGLFGGGQEASDPPP
jgi:hypothetical protein